VKLMGRCGTRGGRPATGIGANMSQMIKLEPLYALGIAIALTGTLPACAVYRKCGFSGCAGDAKISADIRTLLKQYPSLEAPNTVRVQTMNDVVYLYGQVNTDLERSTAESVARSIPGVTQVVDSISLSYAGR
jgi:BON domain